MIAYVTLHYFGIAGMAGIKIYDTGVTIPCAGGVMTPLLNLRNMTALNSNQTE